jgi:hypothetical protein
LFYIREDFYEEYTNLNERKEEYEVHEVLDDKFYLEPSDFSLKNKLYLISQEMVQGWTDFGMMPGMEDCHKEEKTIKWNRDRRIIAEFLNGAKLGNLEWKLKNRLNLSKEYIILFYKLKFIEDTRECQVKANQI